MKRLITFGFFTIFLAISLFGCADNRQNTSNSFNTTRTSSNSVATNSANAAGSNTIIVTNANSVNQAR